MKPQLSELVDLTLSEKLQLVEDLWDHIAASGEPVPVPDWQKRELDRRKRNYEANPGSGVSWEDAKRRMRG
jgi:putative addiction module component (TIGR02574 family)